MTEQNQLQEKALQLRDKIRQLEEGKISAKDLEAEKEAEKIKGRFVMDFADLYFLLRSSHATIKAIVVPGRSKKSVLITSMDKQVEIYYEELTEFAHKWSYRGKDFSSGNTTEGLTDEERLIIAVADALS